MRASLLCVGTWLLWSSALPCGAQYGGTLPAKAFFQQGYEAMQNHKYIVALADFRKAIAVDPNYADAWEQSIFVERLAAIEEIGLSRNENGARDQKRERERSEMVSHKQAKRLQALVRRHPDRPIYLWALAQVYNESDPLRQERNCRKAIKVDPRFFPGYECLALIADLRGDDAASSAYWKKAASLDSDNAKVAFEASFVLQNDPIAYEEATEQLLHRFPTDPVGAQALYWFAVNQKTDAARVQVLERLRRLFPPQKFEWSDMGMDLLFQLEDRTDPARARELAQDILRVEPKSDDWNVFAAYADTMAVAEQQLETGHTATALSTLQSIKLPAFGYDKDRVKLLHARALDVMGNTSDAYELLLDDYARHPSDSLGSALQTCGTKLGKSAEEVQRAGWEAVRKVSTTAIPFTLRTFEKGKSISLADYRGHVVLVDFWFPKCGPCRESFPYLESLARTYKKQGVVVLAINGIRGQEPFVLPLLRAKGYDFVPLKADENWTTNVYHVQGYPTTFLIGRDGRQYFRAHISDEMEERSTALEIDELLAHSGES